MDAVVLLLEMLLHLQNGNNKKIFMLELCKSPLAVTAMLEILDGSV